MSLEEFLEEVTAKIADAVTERLLNKIKCAGEVLHFIATEAIVARAEALETMLHIEKLASELLEKRFGVVLHDPRAVGQLLNDVAVHRRDAIEKLSTGDVHAQKALYQLALTHYVLSEVLRDVDSIIKKYVGEPSRYPLDHAMLFYVITNVLTNIDEVGLDHERIKSIKARLGECAEKLRELEKKVKELLNVHGGSSGGSS